MKIKVRDITFNEGKPKVCLPIVGINNQQVLDIASSFKGQDYDLVELRIDFYESIHDHQQVIALLTSLRALLTCPILFTYRSLKEGGQIQLSDEEYLSLIEDVCDTHLIDLVDIELNSGHHLVHQLVKVAHNHHVFVVMSNHDFHKTPLSIELEERLEKMEIFGADILKIAVMPQNEDDVKRLLDVTYKMSHKLSHPVVTMSMGKLGVVSRVVGEIYGSAMTFATYGKASAPGQINLDEMQTILEVLHHD